MSRWKASFYLLVALTMAACDQANDSHPLQYSNHPATSQAHVNRLIPHPLYNPQKLSETFQPLVDYLNQQVPGANLQLETSLDYQAFEKKIQNGEAAFLIPNPWQTLEAQNVGYHVISMWGNAEDFKGIFIVRKDSDIKQPSDLKGKVVSYPSHTALAGAIMPQYFLYKHGININRDIQNSYVGSQESSIMNVYLRKSAAGATWPPPWRLFVKDHPAEAAQLKVIWETPSLLNNSVMVRNDVPEAIREGVRVALVNLHKSPEGQKILADMETARFHPANDASYEVVREYIKRFEKEVRPVAQK